MIVIYAEKYSLGRTIAEALGAYKKTVNPKEPSIAHWKLKFKLARKLYFVTVPVTYAV